MPLSSHFRANLPAACQQHRQHADSRGASMPWGDAGIQELPLSRDRDPGLSSTVLVLVSRQCRHLLEAGFILPSTASLTQCEGAGGVARLANLSPTSLAAFVR